MGILKNNSNARDGEIKRLVGDVEYSPILMKKVESEDMDCYREVQQYFKYRVLKDDVPIDKLVPLLDVIVGIFKNNPEMRKPAGRYNDELLEGRGIDLNDFKAFMRLEGKDYDREYLNENIIGQYVPGNIRFTARAKTSVTGIGKTKTIIFEDKEVKIVNDGNVEKIIPVSDIREVQYFKGPGNRVMVIFTSVGKTCFSKGDENLKFLADEIAGSIDYGKVKNDKGVELFSKYGGELKEGWVLYGEYSIQEFRKAVSLKTESQLDKALVAVYPNRIEIFNRTFFTKKNVGSRTLFFKNISSVDLDIAGRFEMQSGVQIHMISGEQINLLLPREDAIRKLYNNLTKVYNEYLEKDGVVEVGSLADELTKVADLYSKGLLSEEEFVAMKRKIIGE